MKSIPIILWIQGEDNKEKDILSFCGSRLSSDNSNYLKLYKRLITINDCRKLLQIGNLTLYKSKHTKDCSYIIYSNYLEKDIVGRFLGYMAYIKTNNVDDLCEAIKKESLLYGYTCSQSDLDNIRKTILSDIKLRKEIRLAVILIVALILLYYILF
jgi:hypothetical protein